MAGGRLPDYRMTIWHRPTSKGNPIGAGWLNEDGSITVQLNLGTSINGNNPDYAYKLWPEDKDKQGQSNGKRKKESKPLGDKSPDNFAVGKNMDRDDDIPF